MERTHTRGDWQCRKESRTSPMDVPPPTRPSHRPLVPRLCTPNDGICKPPLAWFHSWRRCATTWENPSSSRSPNPACPMGHSKKTTSGRTQLAFSSMASRNSQPLPPPSTAARTTGPSQRHTSTVRINLQHPLTKKTKRTDSRQCTHHTIQQVILL